MKVYLLTASYSLSPAIKVEEVEVAKTTENRVYFSDRRWAARESGNIWGTLHTYYDNEQEALIGAGRAAVMLLAKTKNALAKAEEFAQKYPVIE